jgi:hypothetical protein
MGRRKGKRLFVCPLCGHSGEGMYWEVGEWDVCEPCGVKYMDKHSDPPGFVNEDADLEGYVRERVAKT